MRKWIPPCGNFVLASSGGSDSLAMAVAVRMVVDNPSRVCMVHVDHGLRKDAWKDRYFATLQAWALGFNFIPVEVWVPRSGNVYEQGRHARYCALASVVGRLRAEFVMTAHHADDLVETMFMRLARGCPLHSSNLISRKINIFGMDVVRPLLSVSRADLRQLAVSSGVPWIDDPSNENQTRERALIRATVGSSLKKYKNDFSSKAAASLLASREADSRLDQAPLTRHSRRELD